MKTKLLFLICCLCAISIKAQVTMEPIVVADGGEYTMKQYKENYFKFTAPENGTLSLTFGASFSTNIFWEPTAEDRGTVWPSTETLGDGSKIYRHEVESGKSYLFGTHFSMSDDKFTVTFNNGTVVTPVRLLSVSPEAGTKYVLSEHPSVGFVFNKSTKIASAKLIVGSKEETVNLVSSNNYTNWGVYPNETIEKLIVAGTMKEGTAFSIKLEEVTDANDSEILYNEDGIITVNYLLGKSPVKLVSASKPDGSSVKPMYQEGDSEGDIVLTFSGNIVQKGDIPIQAMMGYGNIEKDYAEKNVPLDHNGETITLHLQNIDMTAKGLNGYKDFNIKVSGLFDEDGNAVSSNIPGGSASVTLFYNVVEKQITVVPELTPESGSSLDGVTEIECWVNHPITFDGAVYTFKRNGTPAEFRLAANKLRVEEDKLDKEARLIYIPCGNFSHDAGEVTLEILNARDENGATVEISGTYTSSGKTIDSNLSIVSATPANESHLEFWNKLSVTFNRPVGFINTAILRSSDINDESHGISAQAQTTEDPATFKFDFHSDYRLLKGNTYTLVLDTYTSEEACQYKTEEPASVKLTYYGNSDPEVFSDITIEDITPDPNTGKVSLEKNTFVVTFTRPVSIVDPKVNYGYGASNEMAYTINENKVTFTIAEVDFQNASNYINLAFRAQEKLEDGTILNLNPKLYDSKQKGYYYNLNFTIDKEIVKNTTYKPLSIDPEEGTVQKLDVLTLTFNEMTTNHPDKEAKVYDAQNNIVTTGKLGYSWDNDKLGIVTLKEAITQPGTYKVVLPEEAFGSEYWDFTYPELNPEYASCSPELTYTYTIKGLSCINADPEIGSTISALPEMGFVFGFDGVVSSIKDAFLMAGKITTNLTESNYQTRGNRVMIVPPADFSIQGIPEMGVYFTVTDAEGNETKVEARYTINSEGGIPTTFVPTNVDPADNSQLTKLESVMLTFPENVNPDYVGKATFTNTETNEVIEGEFSDGDGWDQAKITPVSPIGAGTYTLVIPEGSIFDDKYEASNPAAGGTTNPELTYTYTIVPTGIQAIFQDITGEVDVYTPQGILIRHADISVALQGLEKGIYIIKGRKFIVE